MTAVSGSEYPFALCLTHDVDRPYKTAFHAVFHAVGERDPRHLRALDPGHNPYWQFDRVTSIEADLGVRSAFYFLNEPRLSRRGPAELRDPQTYVQALSRYDVREPSIATVARDLDDRGWEVGLHGSYHSGDDRRRLRTEKERIEAVLGHSIAGGRQHYIRMDCPATWRHQRAIGLAYDASLGSSTEHGFEHGYDVLHPFDDEFTVFPLTLMDQHLPDPGASPEAARAVCADLLDTAAENEAVVTVLFHPRLFSERDFPGYGRVYRRLVAEALERGAWVGPPGAFHEEFVTRDRRVAADGG